MSDGNRPKPEHQEEIIDATLEQDDAAAHRTRVAGRDASRISRLFAAIIDQVLVSIVAGLLLTWFGGIDFSNEEELIAAQASFHVFLLTILVWLALNYHFLNRYQQTIGKRMLNIRVVSFDDSTLTLTRLIGIRHVLFMLLASIRVFGPVIALVDVLLIFRADRRCLHDLLANTRVVMVETR